VSDIHPFACRACGARITTATARAYGRHCKRCGDAGKVRGPVAQFVPHRTRTFGHLNGVRMTNPFWLYMIGYAGAAYGAYPLVFESTEREHPVWCFRRFGGTRTPVPYRGIVVAIGGEHEDHYDDDFCIYNDVVVFGNEYSGTEIYGYPREEFQPTDFHTATLVGDRIYIVGCLGYPEDRKPERTPVYALDLATMRIDFIPTFGDKPGWVWKHEAEFDADENAIVVHGGQHLLAEATGFKSEALPGIYALDLEDRRWTRRDPI